MVTLLLLASGAVVRLLFAPGGVGGRSAAVLLVLFAIAAWVSGRLLGSPRVAFVAVLAVVLLGNIAALPPRGEPVYDDRTAVYRTDQVLTADILATRSMPAPVLGVLVEPSRADTPIGLTARIGSTELRWACSYQPGMQWLALPVPPAELTSTAVRVELRLTGAPNREQDYLLVYSSAQRGGPLVELKDASELDAGVTRCSSAG